MKRSILPIPRQPAAAGKPAFHRLSLPQRCISCQRREREDRARVVRLGRRQKSRRWARIGQTLLERSPTRRASTFLSMTGTGRSWAAKRIHTQAGRVLGREADTRSGTGPRPQSGSLPSASGTRRPVPFNPPPAPEDRPVQPPPAPEDPSRSTARRTARRRPHSALSTHSRPQAALQRTERTGRVLGPRSGLGEAEVPRGTRRPVPLARPTPPSPAFPGRRSPRSGEQAVPKP